MVVLGPSPAFWNPAWCTWTHKCFQTSQRRIALILRRHPALCEGRGDASGPNVAWSGVDRSKRVGGQGDQELVWGSPLTGWVTRGWPFT